MTGAIVVTLVAVAVMLVLGVVVAVVRLLGAVRQLRSAVLSAQRWLEPAITELGEAGQVASLELAQLQTSIEDLRSGGRPGMTSSPSVR